MYDCYRTLKDLRQEATGDCVPVEEGSDSSDEITEMVVEKPTQKWDCETILCEFFRCLRLIHFISTAVYLCD